MEGERGKEKRWKREEREGVRGEQEENRTLLRKEVTKSCTHTHTEREVKSNKTEASGGSLPSGSGVGCSPSLAVITVLHSKHRLMRGPQTGEM